MARLFDEDAFSASAFLFGFSFEFGFFAEPFQRQSARVEFLELTAARGYFAHHRASDRIRSRSWTFCPGKGPFSKRFSRHRRVFVVDFTSDFLQPCGRFNDDRFGYCAFLEPSEPFAF